MVTKGRQFFTRVVMYTDIFYHNCKITHMLIG